MHGTTIKIRPSIFARAGIKDLAEFDEIFSTFKTQDDMLTLGPEKHTWGFIITSRSILKEVRLEYRELLTNFKIGEAWLKEAGNFPFVNDITISNALSANAIVKSKNSRCPGIFINAGLGLAIEDVLLSACCVKGFYIERDTPSESIDPYPIYVSGTKNKLRYKNYSLGLKRMGFIKQGHYLMRLPIDYIRLAQAELIFELAFRWAILHEQSHWLLGHLDYLQDKYKLSSLALRENEVGNQFKSLTIESKIRYCMELQSDSLATQLLFYYGLSDAFREEKKLLAYKEIRSMYADNRNSYSPELETIESIFRLLLTSACIGCIIFEYQNERGGWRSITHPPPSTRIMNICADALASFGDVVKVLSGEQVDSNDYSVDILKPAMREVMLTLMDLDIVARVIGLQKTEYRTDLTYGNDEPQNEIKKETPLSKDVFEVILAKREDRVTTEGAKHFLALDSVNKNLYSKLAKYNKVPALG